MCFRHDYDWCASICEDSMETASVPIRCDECHRMIPAGEERRNVYQQEYDEEDFEECGDHEGEEPRTGETFTWDCCQECQQVLAAIKASELEEGCKGYESQPALCELSEALYEEKERYLGKLLEMRPDFPREHLVRLLSEASVKEAWDGIKNGEAE